MKYPPETSHYLNKKRLIETKKSLLDDSHRLFLSTEGGT